MPRRPVRRAAIAVVGLIVAANAVSAMHAWRFTHYVAEPVGTGTAAPEALSFAQRAAVLLTGVVVPRPTVGKRPEDLGLKARGVRKGGLAMWQIQGDRHGTVLLFPGYAACKSDLLDEAGAFHDLGWSTVLVDPPGVGDSDGSTTTLGWAEADAVATIAAEPHDGPLVLYGKSMGSAAILRAVGALGVTADALVLENPYDRLTTTVGHRFEALGLPAWPGADLLVLWGGLELGFNGFALNPVDYARDVHVPTLLLTGGADPRVHPDEVRAIDAALAGPHELTLFPGAGHVGLQAADAALWDSTIASFLAHWAPFAVSKAELPAGEGLTDGAAVGLGVLHGHTVACGYTLGDARGTLFSGVTGAGALVELHGTPLSLAPDGPRQWIGPTVAVHVHAEPVTACGVRSPGCAEQDVAGTLVVQEGGRVARVGVTGTAACELPRK